MKEKVRVRFAPSPTGFLHIGGVRTALYNYLFAKKHQGDFILRIEDTDSKRFVPGAEEYTIESFKWLGISFDEGPHCPGHYAPYRQSERRELYKKYVDQLLEKGLAYIAFDTFEELTAQRKAVPNFQYDSTTRMAMTNSLTLSKEETEKRIQAGESGVVRIKIEPDQIITIQDLIRGGISIHSSILDDKVLYKLSDHLPTYHLAHVVDDHLMRITHVIRGEEWLPSAPLHAMLYCYLGWEKTMPAFAHLPLLLKPMGSGKLSKRDGDRLGFPVFPLQWTDPITDECICGYREEGYLPEALINFLVLLGWNPGEQQEIFSIDQLISLFSLEKCSKSGAKFDYKKAKWFNHQYIQQKFDREIADLFLRCYPNDPAGKDIEKLVKIVGAVKERIHFLKDLRNEFDFFFTSPKDYDQKMVQKQWTDTTSVQLKELAEMLRAISHFSASSIETGVKQWATEKNYPAGNLMNALRLSLVGKEKGPHIFQIMEIMGKEETISRIKKTIQALSK